MTSADRRARERQNLQDKILDAARELFARHGYEAVTLRKIAEAIEYTPAAIYGHFRDKDELIRTLCKRDFDVFSAGLASLASIADPLERLRRLGREYIRFAIDHPQHYRLMFMSPAGLDYDADSLERKGDPHRDGYAFLRLSVNQAIEQGLLQAEFNDADLVAQTFWAGVHGVASLQITHAGDEWVDWRSIEARAEAMTEALVTGMSVSKPGARARASKAARKDKPAGGVSAKRRAPRAKGGRR